MGKTAHSRYLSGEDPFRHDKSAYASINLYLTVHCL